MSETRPITNASFNQYLKEKKLMGVRCSQCHKIFLPPRPICTECHSDEMEWIELSGQGTLMAFTSIHVAPTFIVEQGFDRDNPYCAGIVKTEEGGQISARILGVDAKSPETIKIGTPLTVDFIEVGEGEDKRTYLAFKA